MDNNNYNNKSNSMKPLANRVAIQSDEDLNNGRFGLRHNNHPIVPEVDRKKPKMGTILFSGPGMLDEKMNVKVGDKVLYARADGYEIEWEGSKLIVMRETDILAIVK